MAIPFTYIDGERCSPSITVFALSTCAYCQSARTLLKSMRMAFRYVFVDLLSPSEQFDLIRRLYDRAPGKHLYPVLELSNAPWDDPDATFDRVFGFDPAIWSAHIAAPEFSAIEEIR